MASEPTLEEMQAAVADAFHIYVRINPDDTSVLPLLRKLAIELDMPVKIVFNPANQAAGYENISNCVEVHDDQNDKYHFYHGKTLGEAAIRCAWHCIGRESQ